jgi:3'-phosphoadenosine 5'-phosphosulfate sulfotransferase (PAPS reductase)/FAD synthetase
LAFSAGKDSTVLRDLIKRYFPELFPNLILIWGNTGVEYPECVSFARKIANEQEKGTFYEARPGRTEMAGFKYEGQKRILKNLYDNGSLDEILKPDGKLKSTMALEQACPEDLRMELERERLIWKEGTMMSYWWCCDQYGFPLLGKSWSRLDARRINVDTFLKFSKSQSEDKKLLAYYEVLRLAKISQHCCKALKKEPSERIQEKMGVDLIFKGLMASESRSREKNFLTRGYLFEGAKRRYLKGEIFYHCQPMAIWKDADVWDYIQRFNVEYSSLYDRKYYAMDGSLQHIKRNGCLGCGTDFGYQNNHLYILRQTHRTAWTVIMRAGMAQEIRNLQKAFRSGQMTIFDQIETDELIEMQPCILDDMDGLGGSTMGDKLVYDSEID